LPFFASQLGFITICQPIDLSGEARQSEDGSFSEDWSFSGPNQPAATKLAKA
jgi:hypothetical protein